MNYEDKFDTIIRIYRDKSGTLQLTPELEDQVERWQLIREHIREFPHESDSELLAVIMNRFSVSRRTAYNVLSETRRFFSQIEPVNQEFEKILLINQLKKDIFDTRAAGKYKEMATLQATLSKVIGAEKPADPDGGKNTIINVLNYNPTLIGAKEYSNIDELIEKIKNEDKRRIETGIDR
jgi:hypothetical protein